MKKATTAKKSTDKSPQAPVYNKEENLGRLSRTSILENFVRDNNATWDHQKWLEFCGDVERFGYSPIDFDQVGLMLEDIKARYPNT